MTNAVVVGALALSLVTPMSYNAGCCSVVGSAVGFLFFFSFFLFFSVLNAKAVIELIYSRVL